jgi:hypothetical protein
MDGPEFSTLDEFALFQALLIVLSFCCILLPVVQGSAKIEVLLNGPPLSLTQRYLVLSWQPKASSSALGHPMVLWPQNS